MPGGAVGLNGAATAGGDLAGAVYHLGDTWFFRTSLEKV